MAWDPENDGISFSQLDKELRDIINSKINNEDYRSFATSFSQHQTDHTIHLTSTDREHFQYAYDKIVEIIDTEISDAITDITSFNAKFNAHTSDSTVHFTDIERNRWENNFSTMEATINSLRDSINGVKSLFDGYIDSEQFGEQVTSLSNHLIDRNVHITTLERATWNGMEANAKNYSDNKLSNHMNDEDVHLKYNERYNWNQHKDDASIHLTEDLKNELDHHLHRDYNTIHITADDRTKWNGILDDLALINADITSMKADILMLKNKVR